MNLRILAVGKIRERYIAEALDDFRKRLRPYFSLDEVEIKASDGSNLAKAVAEESARILKAIDPHDVVWLLERTGEAISSIDLAAKLTNAADTGTHRITVVIAGTFGASGDLQARAHFLWSLSPLTFLHEWARAIVLEQLYRAAKIARNEPYHH